MGGGNPDCHFLGGAVGGNAYRELAYGYWAAASSGFFRHNEKNRPQSPIQGVLRPIVRIKTAIHDRFNGLQQAGWSGGSQRAFFNIAY